MSRRRIIRPSASSVEPFLRQSAVIVFFGYLQPKQLQPDYVSSYMKSKDARLLRQITIETSD